MARPGLVVSDVSTFVRMWWFTSYHEYTSGAGGKIFCPPICSLLRNRFKARKSLLRSSSFRCASQLSSSVSISRARRSLCSGVSFSTHFALSNLGAGAVVGLAAVGFDLNIGAAVVVDAVDFGDESSAASGGEEEIAEEAVEIAAALGLGGAEGEEKKDVMDALALGFLAALVAISAVLRLRGVAMEPSVERRGGGRENGQDHTLYN